MHTLTNIMCLLCLVVVGGIVGSHHLPQTNTATMNVPVPASATTQEDTVDVEGLLTRQVTPPTLTRSPMLGASVMSDNVTPDAAQRWHERLAEAEEAREHNEAREAALEARLREMSQYQRPTRATSSGNGRSPFYRDSIYERSDRFKAYGSIFGGSSYGQRYNGRNNRIRNRIHVGSRRRVRSLRYR